MDHGAGISKSTAPSYTSGVSSASNRLPASLLDRRNGRRSTASTVQKPADVPSTDSDQDGREVPALAVAPLNLIGSNTAVHPRQSTENSPTRASFRILSSQITARPVVRSHVRDGSRGTTTFLLLLPIEDKSASTTPAQQQATTSSPIAGKPELSRGRSTASEEESLPSSQDLLSRDLDLSPSPSLRGVQLSPYRLFTRRMYTNSPLESPSSQAGSQTGLQRSPLNESSSADKVTSPDTEEASNPHSPCEPFPPFVEN